MSFIRSFNLSQIDKMTSGENGKLLNTQTDELMFVEGKVFPDYRASKEYSIDKINVALGENNVLWVEKGNSPMLDKIWNALMEVRDIVVFDLETTGINCEEDSIIEIGAVKLRNGKIIDKFHSFVSCPQMLSEKVEKLTGISNQDISGAPDIKEVLENFTRFADGCTLASYNLSFDSGFMDHNGKQFERKIDILSLVREKLQGKVNNFRLATVAANYGITIESGTIGSAEAAAKILIKIARYFAQKHI